MTEKQTEHSFWTKAAATGAVLLAGAAAAQTITNSQEAEPVPKNTEFSDSIEAANNAQYSPEDIIGEFTLEQSGLEDPALDVISESLGDDVYNDVKSIIYDAVHESARQHGTVQPGDTYFVVLASLDANKDNVKDYVIVEPTQIVHSEITELPVPETH